MNHKPTYWILKGQDWYNEDWQAKAVINRLEGDTVHYTSSYYDDDTQDYTHSVKKETMDRDEFFDVYVTRNMPELLVHASDFYINWNRLIYEQEKDQL